MKHFPKRIFSLMAATCMAFACAALAACGDKPKLDDPTQDDPNGGNTGTTATYTVNVVWEDLPTLTDALVVNVTEADGTPAGESAVSGGKATFTLEKGNYFATVSEGEGFEGILDGYVFTRAELTATATSATVNIVPWTDSLDAIDYVVTVKLPDGSPAVGLVVQLCGGPEGAPYACHRFTTDANGTVTARLLPGNYDIHIDEPPAGCTFDNEAYKAHEDGAPIEITLPAA